MSAPSRPGSDADRGLAERDRSIPALACLLDDAGLSALLGEAVRVTRIRYKPGTSVLAAFSRSDGGPDQFGWAMARGTGYGQKLQDHAAASEQTDGSVRLFPLHSGRAETMVAVGTVADDWPLRKNLRWLRRHGPEPLRGGDCRSWEPMVLRYNPGRRVVMRFPAEAGPVIVKAAARPYPVRLEPELRRRLGECGVPLLPELADAGCAERGISASPQWGDGDLGAPQLGGKDAETAAYQAGTALAALHRLGLPALSSLGSRIPPTGRAPAQELLETESMVAAVLPELDRLAARVRIRLLERLGAGDGQPAVLAHGDFSPDQVLVAGEGIRFIDFDRMKLAEPEADVGSFAAADRILARTGGAVRDRSTSSRYLTEGYQDAGGSLSPRRVELWAACRMFTSCLEPFRDRRPDWPQVLGWQLERAWELAA